MPQATGALTKIVGVTQTTFRQVPAVPSAEVLYVRTLEYADNQPLEQDPTLAGGLRGQLRGQRGRIDGSGSAVVSLAPSIAFWLKHLIGAPTTTGTDDGAGGTEAPYTHVFKVDTAANPLPAALLLERDFSSRIAAPGRYVRDQDIRIESAAFAFSTASPYQQVTFNLRGASRKTLPTTPIDATPDDFGHAAFGIAGLTLQLDGGATQVCIETLNLNWGNDLDTDLYCLNDGGQRHDLPEGNVTVGGDGVAQFDTPALIQKALADADLAIQIVLKRGTGDGTANNERLTIDIPVSVIEAPTPPVSGPRGLKQNFTFTAYRAAGQEIGVTFTLLSPRPAI